MDRFENKWYKGVIPYSRIIASYAKYENPRANRKKFEGWLRQLPGLDDEEAIKDILFLVDNGRLELEEDARRYLNGGLNISRPNIEL